MTVILAAGAAALFAIGTYLVMQRKLSRIIIGVGLLTHGANLLFIIAGRRGSPPLIGSGDSSGFSDPLPQAMALTAIVISFGVTAFLLALAYRSWVLTEDDEVEDDLTDLLIARGGMSDKEITDATTQTEALSHDEGLDQDEHSERRDLIEPIARGDVPS
ncbi:MAG: sodium:proton antiporter [Microthrixaceae bacterium]